MAVRLVARTEGVAGRIALSIYLVRRSVRRLLRRDAADGRRAERLRFRLGGTEWEVMTESSQLGGIHDVWLGREYDAVPGFRASPGSVVLDVGANVGAYALWQFRNMGATSAPGGVIVAVEAAPTTAARLRRNVELNDAGAVVRVEQVAVWSRSGDVEFLDSARQTSTAGIAATANRALLDEPTTVTIPALTLEDLCERAGVGGREIAILKLDVEGAELEIIRAAAAALQRVERVVVEADDDAWPAVRAELTAGGFDCVGRHRAVGYFVAHGVEHGARPA